MTMSLRHRTAVGTAVLSARAVSWDGCHKIYVMTDDHQAQEALDAMSPEGLAQGRFLPVDPQDAGSRAEARRRVAEWYEASCPLRFVSCVGTADEGEVFTDVVPQLFE